MLLWFVLIVVVTVRSLEVTKFEDAGLILTRNETENELDWWENAVFYQIYPRSFKDSDNDGIGDLRGIIQKLSHMVDMQVTAIWLSPIFKSPQVDQGYDISDYYDIDAEYGTIDDLRELVDRAHDLGIKVILDFVPNHTSDEHEWFQKSVDDPTGEYGDYYVWKDCELDENGTVIPPNNWISLFKGSAWEYNEKRNQCYLHQFAAAQPDLNYRNPSVVDEMKLVLKYWLEFGVDGFRCDAVNTIFEDSEFRDEPLANVTDVDENDHDYLDHIYTMDQPETYDMIYQWREVLDEFTAVNQTDTKVMMTEAYTTIEKTVLYYGLSDGSRKGAHFAFNFYLIGLNEGFNAYDLGMPIVTWLQNLPSIYTYNWVLGNHDTPRVATRVGKQYIQAMNMVAAFLPGVMVTYNGEEIGMENGEVTCEEGHDPQAIKDCSTFDEVSRDFERTPYHWDDSVNAGFNEGAKPWLPVSNKSAEVNLAAQDVLGLPSHYNVYKNLVEWRKIFNTDFKSDKVYYYSLTDTVVQILRMSSEYQVSLVFNIGGDPEAVELVHRDVDYVVSVTNSESSYKPGDPIVNATLDLQPYESVIVINTVVSGAPRTTYMFTCLIVGIIINLF